MRECSDTVGVLCSAFSAAEDKDALGSWSLDLRTSYVRGRHRPSYVPGPRPPFPASRLHSFSSTVGPPHERIGMLNTPALKPFKIRKLWPVHWLNLGGPRSTSHQLTLTVSRGKAGAKAGMLQGLSSSIANFSSRIKDPTPSRLTPDGHLSTQRVCSDCGTLSY